MKYFDSYEVERLRKLILYLEHCLKTHLAMNDKVAYRNTQGEIMFLKNHVLPILLNNTSIVHSEFAKYAIKSLDVAYSKGCNGLALFLRLQEDYTNRPLIGYANPYANLDIDNPDRVEIFVDNIKGVEADLFNLMPLIS